MISAWHSENLRWRFPENESPAGGSGGLGKLVAAELCEKGRSHRGVRGLDWQRQRSGSGIPLLTYSTANGIAEASTVVAREEPDIPRQYGRRAIFRPAESIIRGYANSYMVNLVARQLSAERVVGHEAPECRSDRQRRFNLGSIPLAHFAAYSKRQGRPSRLQRSAGGESLPYGNLRHLRRTARCANARCSLLKFSNMPT